MMAIHPRKKIRDALIALLSATPTAGANVLLDPVYELEESKLPCLVVHTGGEDIHDSTGASHRTQERELHMAIEINALASDAVALDDALDAIASEIEAALAADVRLGGTALNSRMISLEKSVDKGDMPLGKLQINLLIDYVTEI